MQAVIVMLIAFCAWVLNTGPARAYEEITVVQGGTLTGVVTLHGEVPKPKGYNLVTFPDPFYCGRISNGEGWRLLQPFKVDPQGRFKDVVVMIEDIKKGKEFNHRPHRIQAVDCQFAPYITIIRNKQKIEIVNLDPVLHDVQAYETSKLGARILFNRPLPISRHLRKADLMKGKKVKNRAGRVLTQQVKMGKGRNVFVMQRWCDRNEIDLVVVGPEAPLAAGITDVLTTDRRRVFGPSKAAAQIESNKVFAKQLMRHAAIPTAAARIFSEPETARAYIHAHEEPCVVKAAGLAGGKGAIVCETPAEALEALQQLMVSRVFGFARDILIAAILGAGPVADVFFVAFKFPNLFRRLFAEGAFAAAFVPLFAGLVETDGKDAARAFAEQALSVLLWTLLVFVAVVQMAMPVLMVGFAPGFVGDPAKFDLAVQLTRITFPYLLFISLVSLMAGVLNSLGRFWAAAATPILLNVCLIGAVLGLSPMMETPGHALAWGVAGAGMVQFVWLLFHCARAGMRLRLPRPRLTPKVRLLARRILPVAVGAGIYQINLLIDTIIASLLPSGSISYLFYADRVNQLPLGIVGVAVGTALLPMLSRQLRGGQAGAAMHSQNRALEFAFLLTLPAAAALIVIADPVIAVLFERGAFGPAEVRATAAALAVYAVGLPAYVLVKALTPIDSFNEFFQSEFPDEEFDTVAGLVMSTFGHLPKRNEVTEIDGFRFRVLNADSRRVHMLRLTRTEVENR